MAFSGSRVQRNGKGPGAHGLALEPLLVERHENLMRACLKHSEGCSLIRTGGGVGGGGVLIYLQCCEHNLFHGGEVRLPQELRLLPEGQDPVLVDRADGGGDLAGRSIRIRC